MSYVMNSVADGGGGPVEWDTLLDMKTVLNSGEPEISARVLYADTIDASAVTAVINSLSAISGEGGLGGTTSTLISDNDALMAATNSSRFYTGDAAKAQFQSMSDVYTKLVTMLGDIDTIVENKGTIIEKINTYNANLKEWKKNCRIKLLKQAADAWNNAKHVKSTSEGVSLYYPVPDTEWFDDTGVVYGEPKNIKTEQIGIDTYYKYDWVTYKIIKYWAGLKAIRLFKDPGFEKVEAMFDEVGARLPYDPALILPKE